MQLEEYAGVDQYLKGYCHSLNGAFCPETGWFWKVLSEAHGEVRCKLSEAPVLDDFYDSIIEAVNRELGR